MTEQNSAGPATLSPLETGLSAPVTQQGRPPAPNRSALAGRSAAPETTAPMDRIAELAAQVIAVPVTLVSIIDTEGGRIEASHGLEAGATRAMAFCARAGQERRVLNISDTLEDGRFSDDFLLADAPPIRAYLGVPLLSSAGHVIGTLCAMDGRPRAFTDHEILALCRFAKIIEAFMNSQELAAATAAELCRATERARALQASNARLAQESATDYLTALSNRRVFSERSEEASRRFKNTGDVYGLILLDLDNFKQVNDVHGHEVGDEVLRVVGKLLKSQLRGNRDVAARLGGEEFAMLCFGDLSPESLRIIAERIREQLKTEAVNTPQGLLRFTGSFGVALCSVNDNGWKNIYARADSALYEAKASGKDRVNVGKSCAPGATGRFRALRVVGSR